jgi:hypothetical protein
MKIPWPDKMNIRYYSNILMLFALRVKENTLSGMKIRQSDEGKYAGLFLQAGKVIIKKRQFFAIPPRTGRFFLCQKKQCSAAPAAHFLIISAHACRCGMVLPQRLAGSAQAIVKA